MAKEKNRTTFREYAPEKVVTLYADSVENTNRAEIEKRIKRAESRLKDARQNLADLRELIPESLRTAPKNGEEPSKGFRAMMVARESVESAENSLKVARKALDMPYQLFRTISRKYWDDVFTKAFAVVDAANEAARIERDNNLLILAQLHENMVRRSALAHNRIISPSADLRGVLAGPMTETEVSEIFG